MIPSSRISFYSSAIHHVRNLNSWENAKDTAVDTYEGLKYRVKRNTIVSICVGVILISLLILCVYLRCKHRRAAKTMTKEQFDEMMEKRAERKRKNEENRMMKRRRRMDKLRRMRQAKAQAQADVYAQQLLDQDGKNSLEKTKDESDLANTSMETKATILVDKSDDYYDIERDGIEIKLWSSASSSEEEMQNDPSQDESILQNPLIDTESNVSPDIRKAEQDIEKEYIEKDVIEKDDIESGFDNSLSPIKGEIQNDDSLGKKSSSERSKNDDYFESYQLLSTNIEV